MKRALLALALLLPVAPALGACAGEPTAAEGEVLARSAQPPAGYAAVRNARYYVELRYCLSASDACADHWYPVRFEAYARAEPGSYLILSPGDVPVTGGKVYLERVRPVST